MLRYLAVINCPHIILKTGCSYLIGLPIFVCRKRLFSYSEAINHELRYSLSREKNLTSSAVKDNLWCEDWVNCAAQS